MNIIFYRYKSICEPDFIDAFKKLGLEVIEDADGINSSLSIDQKMAHLGDLILDHKPLFIFSINYLPFISLLCQKLHVYYVAETVDCPVFEIYNTSIRSIYNRIFLFDKDQYNSIHDENPDGIFYLPLGAACDRLTSELSEVAGYKYDISFVGSLYNEKDPLTTPSDIPDSIAGLLNTAIEKQLESSVFGNSILDKNLTDDILDWIKKDKNFYPSDMSVRDISRYVALQDYLCPHATYIERLNILNCIAQTLPETTLFLFTGSDTSLLSERIVKMGTIESQKGMPRVFRQSKINLNITTRSITSGLSQRVWDVLACKGFLLTNYQPEIELYFKDGIHLATYSSQEEMLDKIRFYLSHDDERKKIAQKGYDEMNQNGSIVNRVIAIIKTMTS